MTSFYPRRIESRIAEALLDTPVVLLAGPRQAGKTTLVRQIAAQGLRYLTLDDELTLLSAREDPVGLVRSLDRAVIDEIQRAPQLLLAIKKSVDEDRRPGRFLLTGSANLMALPTVSDSLAGRMETLSLLPLSQSEIEEHSANWIDNAFAGRILKADAPALGDALVDRVLRGGYPEAMSRPSAKRRVAWVRQYIDAIIQRDVRDVAGIAKLDQLPRFLRALAQTAGQMCNYTQLGGQVGLDGKTAARYVGLGFFDNGFKQMSANRPLLEAKDFVGLRMRVQASRVIAAQMRALGARPVTLAFSETRRALETGVVDGTENPVSNFWTQNMHQVQGDLSLTEHGYLGYAVVTNQCLWQSLTKTDRELINQAMQEALAFANQIADAQNDKALAALREAGTTRIHTLSAGQRTHLRAAVQPVQQQLASRIGASWLRGLQDALGNA